MGRYADNLKAAAIAATQTATDTAQSAKIDALLTQGTNAPSAKPDAKNLAYYATSTQKLYISTGTSNASDWKEVKAVAIV